MIKIDVILGTRPEYIKLCPLVHKLRDTGRYEVRVIFTGQHREMVENLIPWFEVEPDVNLNVMKENQSLSDTAAMVLTELQKLIGKTYVPDLVIVQGDTISAFIAGLSGFFHKSKVAHIEAGLRTNNKYSPWPEEINRCLLTVVSDLNFCPTDRNRNNLLIENIDPSSIFVTGNTVIDALHYSLEKLKKNKHYPIELQELFEGDRKRNKLILITGHRRENIGQGIINICDAIGKLAQQYRDMEFVYPVHLNPNIKNVVYDKLGLDKFQNIHLIKPCDYPEFVSLMNRSHIILTDSGGVQEEAPSLGKPVLVMRDTTERQEGIEAGVVELVGTDVDKITCRVNELLNNEKEYLKFIQFENPYGNGKASGLIESHIRNYFNYV